MSDVDISTLAMTVNYIKSKLDMIVEAIIGDPTDELKPGVLIRLDRLERSNVSQKKVLVAIGGGLITVIGTIITVLVLRFI